MRILLSMLLSGLALALPFSAFSVQSSHCPPPVEGEEEAECYCHYIERQSLILRADWALGMGATYEEAAEDAKENCKFVVRLRLIEEKGFSETEADQYDYSPHITDRCRPTSCILNRQRLGLDP